MPEWLLYGTCTRYNTSHQLGEIVGTCSQQQVRSRRLRAGEVGNNHPQPEAVDGVTQCHACPCPWRSAVQCGAVQCSAVRCSAVQCSDDPATVQGGAVWGSVVQCGAV
eukprot:scaffold94376_cov24-Tisochrysis_lutea.AAC.2